MPYVNILGGRIWYEDTGGSGTPVVFVHPASGNLDSWSKQIPAFEMAGYRCIRYDLRGWARSIQAEGAPEVKYYSDDLDGLVRALGIERFFVIGAALGGYSAVEAALRFPDRVLGVVLATTYAGNIDPEYVEMRSRIVTPEINALPALLKEVGPSYRGESPEGVAEWLEQHERSRGKGSPSQETRMRVTRMTLAQMRPPTLLIAGDSDLLTAPALMRLTSKWIPGSELVVIPDAGHAAQWERPQAWNRTVLEFLSRHRGRVDEVSGASSVTV